GGGETKFADDSNVGINLRDVGNLGKTFARGIVQGLGCRLICFLLGTALASTKLLARSDDDGIKQTRAPELASCKFLQADAERQHRHQRCDTDANAKRREGVTELGFTQVASGEFDQIVGLHWTPPATLEVSLISLPSPRKIMRSA